jgi:preprotein translocase subunit SecG
MTEFITIVCGLVFCAVCLGIGYLLGKKQKVQAQVEAVIGHAKEAVKTEVNKI